jgi:hypothetical protein
MHHRPVILGRTIGRVTGLPVEQEGVDAAELMIKVSHIPQVVMIFNHLASIPLL